MALYILIVGLRYVSAYGLKMISETKSIKIAD
jgi:hypothetical protein